MLHLYTGPMFSGKTTALINQHAKTPNSILIKYSRDTRYSDNDCIVSHDGMSVDCDISTDDLTHVTLPNTCKDVFIDEGQFFTTLSSWCKDNIQTRNIHVAALNTDYLGREFNTITALINTISPPQLNIIMHTGTCSRCGGKSTMTKRLVESDMLELIGGSDMYTSRCEECHPLK